MADTDSTDKPARRTSTGSRPAVRAARTRRRKLPGFFTVVGPPIALTGGVVLVAALHSALGLPLGALWAAEVWGLAKTCIVASLSLAGFGGYVHRTNRQAWEDAEQDEQGGRDGHGHDDGHDDGRDGQGGGGGAPPSPTIRPSTGRHSAIAVTDTIRRRRKGRLTPVSNELPGAEDARQDGPRARHAGVGGPRC